MQGLNSAKENIIKAKEIVVASHINPDGDSIGSLLSLGLGLEKLGKRVYFVSRDGVPERYLSLPGANRIVKGIRHPCDLAIAVDCSNKETLGKTYEIFKKAKDTLAIDHHEFRRPFANIKFIDRKAAAVGEMIYILLKELNIKLNQAIAQNILTSIIVETNSFRLPGVRALTFGICANLMERGIDFYKLTETVYWIKTKESAILSGISLSRCKFLKRGRLAWTIIRKKDFDVTKGKDEDVDAVADDIRAIKDVTIAIVFREKDRGYLRVSLRSKGKINIAAIAEAYGGGGHFDIAGCKIPNSAKSIKELLNKAKSLV